MGTEGGTIEVEAMAADFNKGLTRPGEAAEAPFKAQLVWKENNPKGLDAFSPRQGPAEVRGKVVVVRRGGFYAKKVANASAAGATALLVINDKADFPSVRPGWGFQKAPSKPVPALLIPKKEGNELIAKLRKRQSIHCTGLDAGESAKRAPPSGTAGWFGKAVGLAKLMKAGFSGPEAAVSGTKADEKTTVAAPSQSSGVAVASAPLQKQVVWVAKERDLMLLYERSLDERVIPDVRGRAQQCAQEHLDRLGLRSRCGRWKSWRAVRLPWRNCRRAYQKELWSGTCSDSSDGNGRSCRRQNCSGRQLLRALLRRSHDDWPIFSMVDRGPGRLSMQEEDRKRRWGSPRFSHRVPGRYTDKVQGQRFDVISIP